MHSVRASATFALFVLLQAALPVAYATARAHGDDEAHESAPAPAMNMESTGEHAHGLNRPMVMKDMEDFPDHPTYFAHTEHTGLLYAHIGLMILAWVIALPLAVMSSIAKSKLAFPSQVVFLVVHGFGMLTSILYNVQTPDLYPNNSHHKLGWAVTWIAGGWTLLSLLNLYTGARTPKQVQVGAQPVSQSAMAQHQKLTGRPLHNYRWSQDSGQGTEPNTASLYNNSRTNSWNSEQGTIPQASSPREDESEEAGEKDGFLRDTEVDRFLTRNASRVTGKVGKAVNLVYVILERGMIPLSFLSLLTGIVTYSGIAMGGHIFNILAHLIKGGIFFGYGILTFGRWMGCFSEFGWAWNLKPGAEVVGKGKARVPSAEFTESFVIFFYGASNVFLEHLAAWGEAWTAMDFEHISITIMFFGGGLLGMLIESSWVRSLLGGNMGMVDSSASEFRTATSAKHPLNPIPSLIILLLGIMMSNHTQHSLVSGQIHRQWGLLFAGFAMSRTLTYVLFWLNPPTTYLPTRPPTELLASFCLISGGIIFMGSNKDTINAMEDANLDSMFIFTVTMGFTALLMAWEVTVIAFKGWVERKALSRPAASPTPA